MTTAETQRPVDLVDLAGYHALVTGAGAGIGRATARMLAIAGAEVGLADRDPDALSSAVGELAGAGHAVWGQQTDVTDPSDVAALMDAAAARSGGCLDALIANVGVMFDDDLPNVTLESWNRCLEINLTSVMLTFQAGLPLLKRSEHASMVAMSSGAGFNAHTLAGIAYASAKAGVAQLVRVLGTRFGPTGIRVNAVAPGAADTAMTHGFGAAKIAALEQRIPLRRLGTADEVANAVLFLVSPLGSYVNGEIVHVSGGN